MTVTRRTFFFTCYCLGLSLAYAPVLRALFDYSRQNVTASHVMVIPLVTAVLIYQDRTRIFSLVRTSWAPAIAVVLVGVGLSMVASTSRRGAGDADWLTWIVGSLVVLSVGGFVLLYGLNASKAALFPLSFLVFMIPFPNELVNSLTLLLKTGSTEAVGGLFSLTGTPHHRDGFVFTLPNLVIEIADECSGIRSSIALFLTTLLTGHMLLEKSINKVLLVLAIVPVAILKNAIRIVCLSLLAIHVDRDFMQGRLHHDGGIVFFLLALLALGQLLTLLRRAEAREEPRLGAA